MEPRPRGRPSIGVDRKFYFCAASEQVERMREAAKRLDISASEFVRRAIDAALASNEGGGHDSGS